MRPLHQLMQLKVSQMTPEEYQHRLECKRKYKQPKEYYRKYYQEHKESYAETNRRYRDRIRGEPAGPVGRPRIETVQQATELS